MTTAVAPSQVCQVADPSISLPCGVRESGGYRCEQVGPHERHLIGVHTIAHSRAGNGRPCNAINQRLTPNHPRRNP